MIGVAVAAVAIVVAGVITFVYCIRRRSKITEMPLSLSGDESINDKEARNDVIMVSSTNKGNHEVTQEKNLHEDIEIENFE